MRPFAALPLLLAAVGALAACGGDDDAAGLSSESVPDDPDVVVVAENMAFDPDAIDVAADESVTIVLDNRDDGVNHNIHLEDAPSPNKTPLELGPSQQALTVTLPAGDYEFVRDIHPTMTGTIAAG